MKLYLPTKDKTLRSYLYYLQRNNGNPIELLGKAPGIIYTSMLPILVTC
jgi:hypothetical protein